MNQRLFAACALLFGSGLCALVYQTVWLREFRLIFGASTAATAAVLGIFMGGLGVGSMLFGSRVEKSRRPLAVYAVLEIAIALAAAATPYLVTLVRQIYIALGGSAVLGEGGSMAVRLALSALVLAVPTLLMGGTLPAVARAVVGREDAGRRSLALLYGVNTLGAVTGALVATFFALEALGNRATLWSACALNLAVALLAALLAMRMPAPDDAAPEETSTTAATAVAPARFVLAAAAIVGFAFMMMELVWYRMLSPLLGGSTFTFGLILAVALLGIGLGGALYAAGSRRTAATLTVFAWTCALEALAIAIPYALGDRLAVFAAHLRSLAAVGFGAHVAGWSLIIAIVILPAAIVAGYQFPLLVALLGRGGRGVASHTARAYALNTAGAIAGSLAGGFGLMSLATAPGLWRFVSLLLAALALAALVVQHRRGALRFGSGFGVLATAALSVALFFTLGPTAAWRHSGVGVGRSAFTTEKRNQLLERISRLRLGVLWEADGVESSVAIYTGSAASFVVNGKSDGNIRTDAGTQVMGGLIGAALLPEVKKACVIGLGTGSTAGWLAALPEIERVDTMELEPAIREMARVCARANLNVLENPKSRLLLGDARELLVTSREQYDLIFSEPSNPYRAGIASLFTTEFYQSARARLKDGGLFLQWVQAYEIDGEAVRMVLATLGGVFAHVEVWTTQPGDLLLIASAAPRTWDADLLRQRLAQEPFKTACNRVWGVDSAEGFLAHFHAGPELTRRIAALPGIERNTDDNTLLEFAFARSVGHGDGFRTPELLKAARDVGADKMHIRGAVDWAQVSEGTEAIFSYAGYPPPPRRPTTPAEELTQERGEIRRLSKAGHFAEAGRRWLQHRPPPLNPQDTLTFALALAEAGNAEALPFIERIRPAAPGDAGILEAALLLRQNKAAAAQAALTAAFTAYRDDPWADPTIQERGFNLALVTASLLPAAAAPLARELSAAPFPGYLMQQARLDTLVKLTHCAWRAGGTVTADVYQPFARWPVWTADFLRARYTFFHGTGLGDADGARQDLATFLAAENTPFDRGLDVKPAPSMVRR